MPDDPDRAPGHALGGERSAAKLFTEVYAELRRIAGRYMRGTSHTLQPTALVHEAYLRMGAAGTPVDRAHFIAFAAKAMRRILIDHARRKRAAKRGASPLAVSLSAAGAAAQVVPPVVDVLALDAALVELATRSERQAHVLELAAFGGLTVSEIGEELGLSVSLVEKELRRARAWIGARLEVGP
jgi:RNA polymerase sigma factor (TIGR02999 family)